MKYNYNQIQDLLNDDSFVEWVLFANNDSDWQKYLIENPSKAIIVNEARQIILEIHSIEKEKSVELDQKLVWGKISKAIIEENHTTKSEIMWWNKPLYRWAASFILMFGIGWLFFLNQSKGKVNYSALVASIEDKNTLIERINKSASAMTVELEDGSRITLEKGSKLSYPSHFATNKRMVVLSGEAFFEIANNPNKPFYVYANEVVTKVLGTSFRIKAFEEDKKVIVKVITGKVSVYNQRQINLNDPETNALILLPNQQAIYNRPSEDLSKYLVEAPIPLTQQSEQLPTEFDEVSADKILEIIEKRYGIKLIYNEEILSNCIITTKLRDEPLSDQLDLICGIIGGTYKEVDAQIIIESKGCNK